MFNLYTVKKKGQQLVMTLIIITIFHYKMEMVQPLIMQLVMLPVNLITEPLFNVVLLGQKAEGKFARPWVEVNPFEKLMKGGATEEATAETQTAEAPKIKAGKKKKKSQHAD